MSNINCIKKKVKEKIHLLFVPVFYFVSYFVSYSLEFYYIMWKYFAQYKPILYAEIKALGMIAVTSIF